MARARKKKELGGPTADRLPIYRVSSGDTSTPMLIELSKRILRIGDNFQMSTRGTSRPATFELAATSEIETNDVTMNIVGSAVKSN